MNFWFSTGMKNYTANLATVKTSKNCYQPITPYRQVMVLLRKFRAVVAELQIPAGVQEVVVPDDDEIAEGQSEMG